MITFSTHTDELIQNNEGLLDSSILYYFPVYNTGAFFKEKSIVYLTEDITVHQSKNKENEDVDVLEIFFPDNFTILSHDNNSIIYGIKNEIELKYTHIESNKVKCNYTVYSNKWKKIEFSIKTKKNTTISEINGSKKFENKSIKLLNKLEHSKSEIKKLNDGFKIENKNKFFKLLNPDDNRVTMSINNGKIILEITENVDYPFKFDPTVISTSIQYGVSLTDCAIRRTSDKNVIIYYLNNASKLCARLVSADGTIVSAEKIICGVGGILINSGTYTQQYYVVRERGGNYYALAFANSGGTKIYMSRVDPLLWNDISGYMGYADATLTYDEIYSVVAPTLVYWRGIQVDSLGRPHGVFITGTTVPPYTTRYIRFNGASGAWDSSVSLLSGNYNYGTFTLDENNNALIVVTKQRPGFPASTTTNVLITWCSHVENGNGQTVSNWMTDINGTTPGWGTLESGVYQHDDFSAICDKDNIFYIIRDARTASGQPIKLRMWRYSGTWSKYDLTGLNTTGSAGGMIDYNGIALSLYTFTNTDWHSATLSSNLIYTYGVIISNVSEWRITQAERYPLHDSDYRYMVAERWGTTTIYIHMLAQTQQASEMWWEYETTPITTTYIEMWMEG